MEAAAKFLTGIAESSPTGQKSNSSIWNDVNVIAYAARLVIVEIAWVLSIKLDVFPLIIL